MVEDGKGTCLSCVSFKLHTFEIYFFSASQNSHLCDAEKIISKIHFYLMFERTEQNLQLYFLPTVEEMEHFR